MADTATMEFSVETAGPCRKRVKVSVPQERVSEEFDKSYRQWIKSVPIPGFRAGKAPRKLVEKRFGEQVRTEVKQALLDAAFDEALKANDLSPITDPELDVEGIELDPAQPLSFDFTVTVKPEFELPDLKSIRVEVPSADPTPEEIDATLRNLRKRKATLRPLKQGKVETDDVVTLKIRGHAGEKELFHHESLPYEVGSRMLADLISEGLDEALTGAKVGDSVKAKGYAPPHLENHPLAGMELDVDAEILELKRPDLPDVDDDFAKGFDFDSKAELVEAVEKDVRRQKELEREKLIENLALVQLAEKSEFDLPQELIEREVDELSRRAAYDLQMRGEPEEEIAKKIAEVRAQRAEESARELKFFFVLDKIVEKERILVTENEVREAVAQIGAYSGKTPEQMYALLRDSGRLGSLRNQLREKKARARLRKRVEVADAKGKGVKAASQKTVKKTAKKAKKKATRKKAKDA